MSEARLRPSSNMLPNRENVACCVKIRNINRDMITVTSQMLTGISSVLICRFSLCWRISAGIKSQNKEKMTTKQQIIVIILSICTDFVQLFSPSYASKVDFNSISLKFWGTVRVKKYTTVELASDTQQHDFNCLNSDFSSPDLKQM